MPEQDQPFEFAPAVTDTESAMVAAGLDDVTTGVVVPVVADTIVAIDEDTAQEILTALIREQDPATEELLDPGLTDLQRDALLAEMRRLRAEADAASKVLSDAAGAQFVADVESELAGQRTPISAGATKADALLAVVDDAIRKVWGPLPWVRYTRPGRVLSINATAHTCKVRLATDGTPGQPDVSATRTVRTGIGVPVVGRTYAVHFPYTLPAAPISLLSGPVPDGAPWLKAPVGGTMLYYLGWTGTAWALYRIALPPMDDLAFTYDPQDALHIGNVDTFAHGDAVPHGLVVTYHSSLIWTDIHRWDSQPTPEQAPSTLPWPTNLHRYKELGTFGPPAQTTDIRPSTAHVEVDGANLDPSADGDYLLGISAYSEQVPEIPTRGDLTPEQRGKELLFDLVASDGGTTWLPVRQRFCYRKNIWVFNTAAGAYVPGFPWATAAIVGATGWVADSGTPWGAAGSRVHVWAINERDSEPYPDGVRLNGTLADEATRVAELLTSNVPHVRYYVSTGGGPATRFLLPLPPGWLGVPGSGEAGLGSGANFPGPAQRVRPFACGTLGGDQLWAWWLGHEAQSFDATTHVLTSTAVHLWYGTGTQAGAQWHWEVREPQAGLEQIQSVNADGSVLIVSALRDPAHFLSTYWISEDAGGHWRVLPDPPFWFDVHTQPQLWLVNTP